MYIRDNAKFGRTTINATYTSDCPFTTSTTLAQKRSAFQCLVEQ